jgi:hypothetical protein
MYTALLGICNLLRTITTTLLMAAEVGKAKRIR